MQAPSFSRMSRPSTQVVPAATLPKKMYPVSPAAVVVTQREKVVGELQAKAPGVQGSGSGFGLEGAMEDGGAVELDKGALEFVMVNVESVEIGDPDPGGPWPAVEVEFDMRNRGVTTDVVVAEAVVLVVSEAALLMDTVVERVPEDVPVVEDCVGDDACDELVAGWPVAEETLLEAAPSTTKPGPASTATSFWPNSTSDPGSGKTTSRLSTV